MTTPMDRLRELELTPDLPRDELWAVIAAAVTEVNDRLTTLEHEATEWRTRVAEIDRRLGRPVQPG